MINEWLPWVKLYSIYWVAEQQDTVTTVLYVLELPEAWIYVCSAKLALQVLWGTYVYALIKQLFGVSQSTFTTVMSPFSKFDKIHNGLSHHLVKKVLTAAFFCLHKFLAKRILQDKNCTRCDLWPAVQALLDFDILIKNKEIKENRRIWVNRAQSK